jgi:hypothetical protein
LELIQLAKRDPAASIIPITRDVVVVCALNEKANAILIAKPGNISESGLDRLRVFQPDHYVSVDEEFEMVHRLAMN